MNSYDPTQYKRVALRPSDEEIWRVRALLNTPDNKTAEALYIAIIQGATEPLELEVPHEPLDANGGHEYIQSLRTTIEQLTNRNDSLNDELEAVLRDWNALVKAIGSKTNGGAVGHAYQVMAELEDLRKKNAR